MRHSARAEAGQAVVIVALMFSTIAAGAGLAVDLGEEITVRSMLQRAVDAAALLGARDVVNGSFTNIQRDIQDVAERNGVADPDGTAYDGVNSNVAWNYVDNTGATVSQSAATGVSVTASMPVPTRFMSIVGIRSVTMTATSVAAVEILNSVSQIPPFAVYHVQGSTDLLTFDGQGNVTGLNPAAVGQTFTIHCPNCVSQPAGNCLGGNSWKGLADTSQAGPMTIGGSAPLLNGSRAGPTNQAVQALGTSFVILPIFDSCPSGNAHIIAMAVFDVQGSGNTHTGTLKSGYLGVGGGSRTWVPGSGLASVLKLAQ